MDPDLKPGDRIELVEMPNDPCPIEPGAQGSVLYTTRGFHNGTTVVAVSWDNGRTLNIVLPIDKIRKLEA